MNKKKSESISSWDIVFPSQANPMGTMFGGKLMAIMDEMSGIASSRFCGRNVVTASTEAFIFKHPIKVGDRIETMARVVWTGNTSLVVKVEVFSENPVKKQERKSCTAGHFTMVALDEAGNPVKVPDLIIENHQEKQDFEIAEIVKKQALIRKKAVLKRKLYTDR
jgi:acyl-CoA hydrolase